MSLDPFVFIKPDFFDAKQSEELSLQLSMPSIGDKPAWIHGDVLQLPKEFKAKILSKQFHTCQFCGFHSKKYQEIVFRHGYDWLPDHAKTACIFCAQCLTVDKIPKMRSGLLIYLPEITQPELNHLAKVIYVARISQGHFADQAKRLLDLLMQRREKARSIISDDPKQLEQELKSCRSEDMQNELYKRITDIRLFPLDRRIAQEQDLEFNQFPQILAYWRSKNGPFGNKGAQTWRTNGFEHYIKLLSSRPKR